MVNPARTRTVSNTLQHPGTASPYRPTNVTIRLNTPGFINGGTAEKIRTRYVTPDATGLWSVDLEVNADIDPAGTSYTVHEAAGIAWTFIVPPGTTPVNLRDILVSSPTNPDPMVAGVPLPGSGVPAGDVWVTDGAGGGDYAPQSGGGGGAPSGPAGGVLAGTYPNPAFAVDMATQAELDAEAATRASADTTNASTITSEASTRASAVTTVTGLVTAEATTARAAESANATAITAEATTARAAESAAQAAAIAAAATDATAKVGTETTRATTAEGLKLAKASNLSDLASAPTSRTNLGLGTSATVDTGTTSGTIPLLSTGGRLPIARIASGTPDGTKYVRDDGTLVTPPAGFASRGVWAASTVYAVGDTVAWQAQTWLVITAHTSGSNFDTTKFAALGTQDPGLMVGLNFACYGHSWLAYWVSRLTAAVRVALSFNGGVGGSGMANAAGQIAKQATSGPNVYIVNCVVNDAASNTAAQQNSFTDGLRAWLDFARAPALVGAGATVQPGTVGGSAGRILHNTGFSLFTFTGTWGTTTDTNTATGSKRSTTTLNDSFTLDWFGDQVSIMLMAPTSGNGAAYSVTMAGTSVATGTIANSGLSTIYQPLRLSGMGPGWHTAVFTKTDATGSTLTVDCAVVPSATPPLAVVVKDPPPADSGHPYTSLYAGLIDTVVAESFVAAQPIVVVDPAAGTSWDTQTDITSGGFHPSDQGANKLWKKIYTAIAVQPYRAGQNAITYADSIVVPAAVVGSDNFTRTNNAYSLGSTSTGGYPWKVLKKSAVFSITSNTAQATASAGTPYQSAVIQTGKADTTITWVVSNASNAGLLFRSDDSLTGYYWYAGGGLNKLTNGTSPVAQTAATGSATTFANGDTLAVVLSGTSITLKKNGTTVGTFTDSTLTANTEHGLLAYIGVAAWSSFSWT